MKGGLCQKGLSLREVHHHIAIVENIIFEHLISDIIKGHEKIIPFIAVDDSCSCGGIALYPANVIR